VLVLAIAGAGVEAADAVVVTLATELVIAVNALAGRGTIVYGYLGAYAALELILALAALELVLVLAVEVVIVAAGFVVTHMEGGGPWGGGRNHQ
jgi:hypothetical protein